MNMKNIIFDLGGVILKDEPITFLKKLNIDDNTYNQLKIFFDDWNKLDLGEESLEDKYNKCNFPIEYDNLYKDKLINYYKYREIDIRLIECINKLKENGYNVYVISDNNKECSLYYKNNPSFKLIIDLHRDSISSYYIMLFFRNNRFYTDTDKSIKLQAVQRANHPSSTSVQHMCINHGCAYITVAK